MKRAENIELVIVLVVVVGTVFFNVQMPKRIQSGYFVLTLGLLFLIQTLLRDIWLMFMMRKKPRDSMLSTHCMCLEAGIGFIPVIASAVLLGGGYSREMSLSGSGWILSVASVLLAGLWLKNYVFELRPFRIRKDPDHINFVYRRKSL